MQSVTELLNAVDRADAIYYGPNPNRNKISDPQYDGWKKELADHLKLIQNNLALHPNSLLAPRQRDEIKAIQERINRKRSPLAMRNCSSTRSRPVTISVTGCSTCKRVLTSMK